jgi:shikimate dehydrogenase
VSAAAARKAAVLGFPAGQALSPVLHRAAYRELGLDWTYQAIDLTPARLPGFLAGLDGTWAGLSLTMPLKRAAVPLLHEASAAVRETGCANTVTIRGGRLLGDNTDVAGMLAALHEAGVTRAGPACVLGAGATAATALAALRALGCPEVTAVARDTARGSDLEGAAERIGIPLRVRPWNEAARHLTADLVISALPPGAADPLAALWPACGNFLLDVTYRPWPSALARAALRAGSTVAGGLPMLVHQAARQVELQTGRAPAPLAAMRHAAGQALSVRNQPG